LVFPATDLPDESIEKVKEIVAKLAEALKANGPFNMQFLFKENNFRVIEVNLRASRSFPFICKVIGLNFMRFCATLTLGKQNSPVECDPKKLGVKHVGCKAPKFSYKRLLGSDPLLGLEMASTGEVGTVAVRKHIAFLKSYLSTGDFKIPKRGTKVLICADYDHDLKKFLNGGFMKKLAANFEIFIFTNYKDETAGATKIDFKTTQEMIMNREFSLFLSFTRPLGAIFDDSDFAKTRKRAIQFTIPAFLNEQLGEWFTDAMYDKEDEQLRYDLSLQDYLHIDEKDNENWQE